MELDDRNRNAKKVNLRTSPARLFGRGFVFFNFNLIII